MKLPVPFTVRVCMILNILILFVYFQSVPDETTKQMMSSAVNGASAGSKNTPPPMIQRLSVSEIID